MNYKVIFLFSFMFISGNRHNANSIIGLWMSRDNNLEVEVFKTDNDFRAKVIWFDDSDDKAQPFATRCDSKNPDKTLQKRKILGMEVMHGLVYNMDDDEWENGRIYDASTGKDWNAKAWLTDNGTLKVRGYWHFEFLGENMTFRRI